MPHLSYFEALRRINAGKESFPVNILYGFHESLGEMIIQSFTAAFLEDKTDFNYRRYYLDGQSDHDWEEIINEVNSSSFFIQSRKIVVVVIREVKKIGLSKSDKELLQKYLKKPNPNSILIIYISLDVLKDDFKQLKKQKITGLLRDLGSPQTYDVDLDQMSEREVQGFIKQHLQAQGIRITANALERLIEIKGDDFISLLNQVSKFEIVDTGEDNVLDAQDIDWLASGVEAHSIWDLTEAIEQEDMARYLKILQYLFINGVKPTFIIGTLITHYNKIYTAKFLLEHSFPVSDIGKILQQPSFILNKFIRMVRNFSPQRLRCILDMIYQLDYESKTSGEDSARVSLQNFIFQLKLINHQPASQGVV